MHKCLSYHWIKKPYQISFNLMLTFIDPMVKIILCTMQDLSCLYTLELANIWYLIVFHLCTGLSLTLMGVLTVCFRSILRQKGHSIQIKDPAQFDSFWVDYIKRWEMQTWLFKTQVKNLNIEVFFFKFVYSML